MSGERQSSRSDSKNQPFPCPPQPARPTKFPTPHPLFPLSRSHSFIAKRVVCSHLVQGDEQVRAVVAPRERDFMPLHLFVRRNHRRRLHAHAHPSRLLRRMCFHLLEKPVPLLQRSFTNSFKQTRQTRPRVQHLTRRVATSRRPTPRAAPASARGFPPAAPGRLRGDATPRPRDSRRNNRDIQRYARIRRGSGI